MSSYLSQIGHLIKYTLGGSKMELGKGALIISIDIDVGNKELGLVYKRKNHKNTNMHSGEYSIGAIEELALPMFLNLFEEFELPVTFAIRGQWLDAPNDVLTGLLKSSIKHDVGGHGYYHRRFKYLSREEADSELAKIHTAMHRLNLTPISFVFPGNRIAHLDLLVKYGFKCYRERGNFLKDGMYIRRHCQLWDVHPSLYVDCYSSFPVLKKILDLCSHRTLPFHIWFHLWNFGEKRNSIERFLESVFVPFLRYAKHQAEDGLLAFETMASVVRIMETESNLC
jgi:peptidoglycan/xylan/chitin deacetylase (PgdA/CDA1 family)